MRPGAPAPRWGSAANATERWTELETLLHEALARDPEERASYLDSACRDAGVRRELDALLDAHESSGPLDALARDVMGPLLPHDGRSRAKTGGADAMPLASQRYRMI